MNIYLGIFAILSSLIISQNTFAQITTNNPAVNITKNGNTYLIQRIAPTEKLVSFKGLREVDRNECLETDTEDNEEGQFDCLQWVTISVVEEFNFNIRFKEKYSKSYP